ncbi:anterior gradient 1 [Plectropomus leopardus]|uniref:anterior gradient 1 n=1 Tax=Plectropomus leopardus TaxID=160734 RepID=UPI001C4A9CAC|nr:anterior gradient 1 [Plectropomus leopardus]XP_042351138.1 anterior gradient 1 [Plectropomus leopardus]
MLRWVLFVLFLGLCSSAGQQKKKVAKPQSLARGWGNGINWVKTYAEGLSKMVETQKPLMVIHHQDDCPYCQALKKVFATERSIQKMAKEDFIMLNLLEETSDKNMAPDGYYVPRILFVDPSRTVRTDIKGKYNNFRYTYEPSDMSILLQNMKTAKVPIHTDL